MSLQLALNILAIIFTVTGQIPDYYDFIKTPEEPGVIKAATIEVQQLKVAQGFVAMPHPVPNLLISASDSHTKLEQFLVAIEERDSEKISGMLTVDAVRSAKAMQTKVVTKYRSRSIHKINNKQDPYRKSYFVRYVLGARSGNIDEVGEAYELVYSDQNQEWQVNYIDVFSREYSRDSTICFSNLISTVCYKGENSYVIIPNVD